MLIPFRTCPSFGPPCQVEDDEGNFGSEFQTAAFPSDKVKLTLSEEGAAISGVPTEARESSQSDGWAEASTVGAKGSSGVAEAVVPLYRNGGTLGHRVGGGLVEVMAELGKLLILFIQLNPLSPQCNSDGVRF